MKPPGLCRLLCLEVILLFQLSTCNEIHHRKFNGVEMKVLAFQFDPLFTYKKQKDGNYTFGGFVYEVLEYAKNYFDVRYKFVIVNEVEVRKNGLIGPLLKHLDDKDVDVVPYFFDQELNNLKHMELTSTIWIDPFSILQPYPGEKSRLLVTARPFQLMVWVAFFGSTILFVLITTAFIKIQERVEKNKGYSKSFGETVYFQFEYVLTIIAIQGNSIRYNSWTSLKIMIGLWLLSMVVLIYAYTGVMTALLTVPKLEPIAFTLEEVVLKHKFCLTEERNTPMIRAFLEATEGYEKEIGDQFRKDPTLYATDTVNAVEHVLNRNCAYPSAMTLINYVIYEDVKANGHCRMTASPELKAYKSSAYQIGLPHGSPFAATFNEFFLQINAAGVVSLMKKTYFPSTKKCRTDVPPESETRVLTLLDVAPAFLILGLGISLSFIAFLTEIIAKCIICRKEMTPRILHHRNVQ